LLKRQALADSGQGLVAWGAHRPPILMRMINHSFSEESGKREQWDRGEWILHTVTIVWAVPYPRTFIHGRIRLYNRNSLVNGDSGFFVFLGVFNGV